MVSNTILALLVSKINHANRMLPAIRRNTLCINFLSKYNPITSMV